MDGESGESVEEEEETDVGRGELEVQRLVRGSLREIGSNCDCHINVTHVSLSPSSIICYW